MSTATSSKSVHAGEPWHRRAPELTMWTVDRVVVNWKRHGKYKPDGRTSTAYELTEGIIGRHFRATERDHVRGVHSTAIINGKSVCRWCGWDIDSHDGDKSNPAANLIYALVLYRRLAALGFRVLLTESNGTGGFHVRVFFSVLVPSEIVFRFAQWAVSDHARHGLSNVETFPKQPTIIGRGKECGNWMRLPGRHHKRDHWSRVWDEASQTWLDGDPAIDAILACTGDDPALIPDEAKVEAKPANGNGKAAKEAGGSAPSDPIEQWLAKALQNASGRVATADVTDRHKALIRETRALAGYLHYGKAFTDDTLADVMTEAGRRADPNRSDHGETVRAAIDHGNASPLYVPAEVQENADRQKKRAESKGDNKGPAATTERGKLPAVFRNFRDVTLKTIDKDTGKPQTERRSLRAAEIAEALAATVGPWPKRVDETLFIEGGDHKPVNLDSSSRLFAWIDRAAPVDWTQGSRFITQERFYEHLRMTSERFSAVETLPHWPRLDGVFYMHPEIPKPSGRLDEFLAFFRFASDVDRELARALVFTLFWGGAPESRPAFLATGKDRDTGMGRGLGKTMFMELVADLVGGYVDVSPTDQISDVKTRLLSPAARQKRIARLDNVKTLRFSWADLEGLITASEISGRALYVGEGRRPNTLVWCITLNGVSLSKDMAQRVIVIRLDRPTFRAEWEDDVRRFIREHRLEIMADVRYSLETYREAITPATRWAAWESGVLAATNDPAASQKAIVERQGTIDDDNEERDLVAAHFAARLRERGHDPEGHYVAIPSQIAAEWLSDVISPRRRIAANTASSQLANLAIPQLERVRKTAFRGWYWRGEESNPAVKTPDELKPPPSPPIWSMKT
jgi:hypothetical protein